MEDMDARGVLLLGSGGFGITYLARDVALDKPVAIKEYMPSDLAVRQQTLTVSPKSGQDKSDFDWGLDRFLDEARTLARFDHPNVVKVSRFFRAHGTAYIVMEHVSGETLSEVLQRKGRLGEAELRGLVEGLLSGLEAVHAADYLHRDIKPGNVILRPDGTPVLLDFGSARQSVTAKSRSVTAIVTPGYAPIEQYSSRGNQGPWTDIYAVGAICYRAMTGEVPVDATERVRRDPLVPVSEHPVTKGAYSHAPRPGIPAGFVLVLR
jgi:serine/threonine protein kinase